MKLYRLREYFRACEKNQFDMVFSLMCHDFDIECGENIGGIDDDDKRVKFPLLRRKFAEKNGELGKWIIF